jgi:putative phage-type endonuclease
MKANEAQNTEGWMLSRCGMFTASRAADLMARTKTGPSKSRDNLIALLVVERLTGQPVETYQNDAMRRGTELEAEARDAYSFTTSLAVEETGFVTCDDLPNTGCSPDGLIGDDGLVEIKCPASMAKHLDALLKGSHAVEYAWQLQHQLMVTGRAWVDAVSYDSRFPEHLQLAVVRVFPNEPAISELREAIMAADVEIFDLVGKLAQAAQKVAA